MKRLLCLGLLLWAATVSAQGDHWEKLFQVNQRFAQAGSKEGQFKLAEMYEQGVGTPVDQDKARHWYQAAAQQGHEQAARRVADWDAYLAGRRRQAEEARLVEQREEQAARAAAQRAEEERARLIRQRAEQERAQQAAAQKRAEQQALAKKRREEEQARAAAQRRAEQQAAAVKESPAAPSPAQRASITPADNLQAVAPAPAPAVAETPAASNFETDPCKTPAARFMSTCRGK